MNAPLLLFNYTDELLVTFSPEEGGRTTPTSPQPRVGHIISIEDSPESDLLGLGLEEHEDSSALVKISSDSDSTEERKELRPVRPAPPKPRPHKSSQRAGHLALKNKTPPSKVGISGKMSPPSAPVASPQGDLVPMLGSVRAPLPSKPPR